MNIIKKIHQKIRKYRSEQTDKFHLLVFLNKDLFFKCDGRLEEY